MYKRELRKHLFLLFVLIFIVVACAPTPPQINVDLPSTQNTIAIPDPKPSEVVYTPLVIQPTLTTSGQSHPDLSGLIITGGQEAYAFDPGCVLINNCMETAIPLMEGYDNTPLMNLPWLSPTGNRLAFDFSFNFRQRGMNIYTSDLNGENVLQLTFSGEKENLTWSPDGEQIAFTTRTGGTSNFLDIVDANHGTLLTRFREIEFYNSLAWSPDGKRIAFLDTPMKLNDLYVVDAETGEHQLLASGIVAERPRWSPNGRYIAVPIERDGNIDIYLILADGSGERRITTNPSRDDSPKWSPDSQYIIFESNRDGNTEIYLMDVDGSDQRRLTHEPSGAFFPIWSPDGEYIAFTTNRHENYQVYLTSPDGNWVERLTYTDYDVWVTSIWTP